MAQASIFGIEFFFTSMPLIRSWYRHFCFFLQVLLLPEFSKDALSLCRLWYSLSLSILFWFVAPCTLVGRFEPFLVDCLCLQGWLITHVSTWRYIPGYHRRLHCVRTSNISSVFCFHRSGIWTVVPHVTLISNLFPSTSLFLNTA